MKRSSLSLAIAVGIAGAAAPVVAQDAAPATDDTRLNEVTVTARKRVETLQDVPIAVTAFTPDALDRLNVRDLGDLNAFVPNLTIYAARGSSSTVTAYIRGIGQSDPLWGVDPGVGIYLDDVYVARPQGGLLDVFDVQRVEVLRGPQGTLYGKNTIGGAIKYISRDLPTELEGSAELTIGNHNQLDAKAAIGSGWNDGAVRARVAVASLTRDGFGENVRTGQEVSDKEILAGRASFGFFPSDTFDIRFTADWMDDQSGVRGARMLGPNPFVPGAQPLDDRYDVRNGMPNVNDTSMSGASMVATWYPGSAWVFKSVTAWRESDTETNIDFDALPNVLADVKAFYDDEQFSQEFQASFDNGGPLTGVAGIYLFDGRAGGQVLNNFFNLLFGDTQGDVDTESVAVYADGSFAFNERWSVSAGLRWTDEEKSADVLNRGYSDATYTTPISVAADFEDSVSFSNVSPRISVDFKPTDDMLLYALASRGFKSGGFNIRANAVAVPRSARPFDDEQVDSVEVGAKMAFLDNRAFVNVAYFHNRYEDIQLSVFTSFVGADGTPQFFGDFTNAGRGTVDGVEVEYQFRPSRRWNINGHVAWLDARYDEFISGGVDIADDQAFTNAPEWSGALNIEHVIPVGTGELAARVGYYHQSEVIPTTDLSTAITQPGYGLVSAGVVWQNGGPWTLSLQGSNLTDKEYRTTGYNIPALGVLTGFYGPPRQVMLSARYSF